MRPALLLASLAFSVCALASSPARAAEPSNPFAAPAATTSSPTPAAPLPDPFAAAPASAAATDPLADPFAVAPAPRCPARATASGLVIQRPASAPCPDDDAEVGLRDPFGA